MKKRKLTRLAVRRRAPKLPTGAMLTYRAALRRALEAQQAKLLARILASYKPPPERSDGVEAAFATAIRRAFEQATRTGRGTFTITVRTDAGADGSLDLGAAIPLPPEVLDTVGRRVAKKTHDETKRLVGISRKTAGVDQTMIDVFRKRNLSLISTLTQTQVDELRDVLDKATEEGWSSDTLRDAVLDRFDVTKSHADLIARDQTLKLNGQLTRARQQAVGIAEYIWSSSNDERTRESHAELDGERFSWDDPPEVDGERVAPGEAINCRCVAVAVVPWLDEESDDEEAA